MAFSPDGKTVLTGSDDKTARLWDAATGKPIGPPLQHQRRVNAVAFSPDGKTVLTGSMTGRRGSGTRPRASPSGRRLQHQGEVNAVAFSPDGKTVLTGSWDRHGAALGRGDRQAHRAAAAAPGRGQGRGVQPRRQDRRSPGA